MSQKLLLSSKEITIILQRLACQLIENHTDFKNTVLIGLQPRGIYVLNRLLTILKTDYNLEDIHAGYLDITFYRDDFRRKEKPLQASATTLKGTIENKNVVFIDDVLFTGRSINAALIAIQAFGRPDNVQLLVLIDRRFSRHLPIQPTYKGCQVDAIFNQHVKVEWEETDGQDAVFLKDTN